MKWFWRSLVVAALVVGGLAVLDGPFTALRREVLVADALDALERGLARHVERLGVPVEEPFVSGGELARMLVAADCLTTVPLNPDTGAPFGAVELEPDLIFYSVERDGRWLLEALAADGREVVAVRRP